MTRELLAQILGSADGIQGKASTYAIDNGYEAALYLGELGRAMSVSDIARLLLHDSHIEVQTRNDGTLHTTYDVVRAVATRRTREPGSGRTGFG